MSIQTFIEPYHLPCPDMAAYSLNKEQKAKGLEMLKKVKAQVREGMLSNLRKEYEQTESPSQRSRINQRANRIKRNWS
ncbi:hypothetical protein [Vibrio europaeus]|uniref:hypothetical protein n=1 Tax=Vibrio europaeus TaxID=300876 RepID=UPI00148BDC1A|nr:hypothetical protein [Vibrio europaeus]NOH22355.1 hypothetical protein [Vibrio europaeus]